MRRVILSLLSVCSSLVLGERIEKIEQCGVRCSQGHSCKSKPYLPFMQCKNLPDDMDREVFKNVTISTVMRCEERQRCSIHLRVNTALKMNKHIHGIYMCIVAGGMMERCRIVTFPRSSRGKLVDMEVNIEEDCLEVGMGQNVHLTLRTSPQFCNVFFSRSYHVPDCSSAEIRRSVPECITGSIHYEVDLERKKLSVSVTDMLEDRDYHLRLCHKGYICMGTGSHALIKKENPLKNATLTYSKALPCLCIEGWSVMADAPRVQVCPFKDHMDELWSGITFNPVDEALTWEAECNVNVEVTLCKFQEGGMCQDFDGSSQVAAKGKVMYTGVDAHPQLCMKFTTQTGTWVRCPFSEGNFPAWDLDVTTREGHPSLLVTSRIKTTLLLSVCAKTGPTACEDTQAMLVNVEKFRPVESNLTIDLCEPSQCIKAKRMGVKYGVSTVYCHPPCSHVHLAKFRGSEEKWQLMHVILVVLLTAAVIVFAAVMGIVIIVCKLKQMKKTKGICLPGPHTDSFSQIMEQSTSETQLARKSSIYDICGSESPSLKDCERSNLLNGFTNHINA